MRLREGSSYGEIFIDIELDFLARQGPDSKVGKKQRSAFGVRRWERGQELAYLICILTAGLRVFEREYQREDGSQAGVW